jgi:hypothetical protein
MVSGSFLLDYVCGRRHFLLFLVYFVGMKLPFVKYWVFILLLLCVCVCVCVCVVVSDCCCCVCGGVGLLLLCVWWYRTAAVVSVVVSDCCCCVCGGVGLLLFCLWWCRAAAVLSVLVSDCCYCVCDGVGLLLFYLCWCRTAPSYFWWWWLWCPYVWQPSFLYFAVCPCPHWLTTEAQVPNANNFCRSFRRPKCFPYNYPHAVHAFSHALSPSQNTERTRRTCINTTR